MEDSGKSYEIVVEEAKKITDLAEAKHMLRTVECLISELEDMKTEYRQAESILKEKIEGELAIADALAKEELNEL